MTVESNKHHISKCNGLACLFHGMKGYDVPTDTEMYECEHHDEVLSWFWAVTAYEYLVGIDMREALNNPGDLQ